MEIEIGKEYNIRSINRRDHESYIFRGIPVEYLGDDRYRVRITEYNINSSNKPGSHIPLGKDRFRSLVARTNKEAKFLLSKEW